MTYELAKQLKEAGFPQTSLSEYKHIYPNETAARMATDGVREPNLSELIEACKEGFDTLTKNSDSVWHAGIGDGADGGDLVGIYPPRGEGLTPEEALAKLWLILHETVPASA